MEEAGKMFFAFRKLFWSRLKRRLHLGNGTNVHKGPVRKSHMATRGKLNYLPSQVFCNEGQTTILVEMWEKMSEKLNLWKDEEIKR
jgi:hypothetical protein